MLSQKLIMHSVFVMLSLAIGCLHASDLLKNEVSTHSLPPPILAKGTEIEKSRCSSSLIQRKHSQRNVTAQKYDYIIVGNGTAGAVLARKLSDNFKNKVLVIEAGINLEDDPIIQDPNFIDNLNTLSLDPKYAITYATPLFQPGQAFDYSVGRGWGGSSMHNFLFAVRGSPPVYNGWAAASGNSKWSYDNALPFMKALETYTSNGSPIDTAQRGTSGPLFITQGGPIQNDPWAIALAGKTGLDVGLVTDYNDPTQGVLGVSSSQLYVTPGPNSKRSYSATAYLPVGEVVNGNGKGLHRRQLKIVSQAYANRVLFKDKKAIGVEYSVTDKNGNERIVQVFGKKIILSAGSISSPAILERSGIGDPAILKPLGIPLIVKNNNVGNHLQNQYGAFAVIAGGLQPGSTSQNAGIFTDGRPFYTDGVRRLQIITLSGGPEVQLYGGVIADPKSLGSVHIVSRDPKVNPRIDFNLYSDGPQTVPLTDANLVVTYYKIAQNIANAVGGIVVFPTPAAYADPTGALLLQAAQSVDGVFIEDHACGTTRMAQSQALGVVDGNLRVFGVKNLYVADNGVAPISDDGNTAYTAYVIGLILADELTE